MNAPDRLRIVFFGSSILSDWNNPDAAAWRDLLDSLAQAGHDVTFLEERNNRWLVGLLQERGAGPVRDFDRAHPGIARRTYDPPIGSQPGAWFAQLVGTTDAIIALPGTPPFVLDQIAAFKSRSVVRGLDKSLVDVSADFSIGGLGDATPTWSDERVGLAEPMSHDDELHHHAQKSTQHDFDGASRQADRLVGAIHRARATKRRTTIPPA